MDRPVNRAGVILPVKEADNTHKNGNEKAFWSVCRPLAILSVVGGIAPYPWPRREDDVDWKLRRRWPTLIHFILLVTYVISFSYQAPEEWIASQSMHATERSTFITYEVMSMGGPWLNFLLVQLKIGQVWKLLHLLSHLDVTRNKRQLRMFSKGLVVVTQVFPLISLSRQVVRHAYRGDLFHPWQVFYMVFEYHCAFLLQLIPVQIMFMAIVIRCCLKNLNDMISGICRQLASSIKDGQSTTAVDTAGLSNAADQFYDLCDLVEQVDDTFGVVLTSIYLLYVVITTSCLFYFFIISPDGRKTYLVFFAFAIIIIIVKVTAFTVALGSIPRQSTTALKDLIRISRLDIKPEIFREVQALIYKMTSSPIEVTAASYFSVNRGLLTSVVGAVATYLIVLAQFEEAEQPSALTNDSLSSSDAV